MQWGCSRNIRGEDSVPVLRRPFAVFVMRCHVMCHVAMQVVRSLRIRSRCLAMRTGKAYDTSAAARSDQRQRQLIYRYELPAEAKNASKSLFFRCAQPEADAVLSTALSRARIHAEERRALAGHFAGSASLARRLCEAARRRQARVTASARLGRSFDDRTCRRVGAQTRRHPACMRQCAVPPRGAERGRKSAGTVVFTALPKLRCVTSQYRKKGKREGKE